MSEYNRTYVVYKHTNKINGKIYIGITKNEAKKRWNNGLGYKNNSRFYDDIEKYGWDQFTHEILETNLTKMEATILESELIAEYKSDNYEFGYNLSSGLNKNIDITDDSRSITLTLRINKKMRDQLEYIADNEYRTINSLLTYICAKYIDKYNEEN